MALPFYNKGTTYRIGNLLHSFWCIISVASSSWLLPLLYLYELFEFAFMMLLPSCSPVIEGFIAAFCSFLNSCRIFWGASLELVVSIELFDCCKPESTLETELACLSAGRLTRSYDRLVIGGTMKIGFLFHHS